MDLLYEIVKVISPTCITGLVTFWVTKYNYNRNIPLDKLEITYNRVYYPILCKIKQEKDVIHIIEASESIFKKYNKYVDQTTRVALNYLKNNSSDNKAYNNFKDNIYGFNSKLRRRLGYLEPNLFNAYKYMPPNEKRLIRISIEAFLVCFFLQITLILHYEPIQKLLLMFILIFLLVLFCEVVIAIGNIIIKRIKICVANRKDNKFKK